MKKMFSIACLIAAGTVLADSTPVMLSLVTPVQVPSREYDVTGLRLSLLYGDCQDFAGLDIGLLNISRRRFTGLAVSGMNSVGERFCGAQLGLVNFNGNDLSSLEHSSIGAQVGVLNYAGTFCGLQDGLINISSDRFLGLQASLVNCAEDLYGLQCGFYFIFGVNAVSGSMRGCQIGLVNYANRVDGGCQIGLVNIITENGWMPVLPIVNGSF